MKYFPKGCIVYRVDSIDVVRKKEMSSESTYRLPLEINRNAIVRLFDHSHSFVWPCTSSSPEMLMSKNTSCEYCMNTDNTEAGIPRPESISHMQAL